MGGTDEACPEDGQEQPAGEGADEAQKGTERSGGSAQLGRCAWPPCQDGREAQPGGGREPLEGLEYGRGVMKGAFERVLSTSARRTGISRSQPWSPTVTVCW